MLSGDDRLKYENGKDVFPERLLRQIQKYISGRLVYIPANNKREWGDTSGICSNVIVLSRQFLMRAPALNNCLTNTIFLTNQLRKLFTQIRRYSQWNTNLRFHQLKSAPRMVNLKNGFTIIY